MKKPAAIDANIILRFLTNDDPAKAEACAKLLEKVERNECRVWLPDLVLADIVWTLEKFYRTSKTEIAELLTPLVSLRGMHCPDKESVLRALVLYTRHNIDWTDAFVAAQIVSQGTEMIFSYDRDFDKIGEIKRIEP
jgi:predicted nucleic-acid-binding protein